MTGLPTEPDVGAIVALFDRHGVAFVLVGGAAATLLGATRQTFDVDAVVATERANLERAAAALIEAGARLRIGGMSDDDARQLVVPLDAEWLARTPISTWQTDLGALDLLAGIPDLDGAQVAHASLDERASAHYVDGIAVRVASLDDIIASKRRANRRKDRDALDELEALRSRRETD